jgi:cobalt-zinc-cadmium efflux system membrane fusion protein
MNFAGLRTWPGMLVAVVVACGLGFFVARMTVSPSEPATPQAAGAARPDSVSIAPDALAAVGIATETAGAGTLASEVLATATVHSEIRGEAILMAHVPGVVAGINVRVGDQVKAGDTLAVVSGGDAAGIASARDSTSAKLAQARAVLSREKELFEKQVTPREALERAQADFDVAEAAARQAGTAAKVSNALADGTGVRIVSPLSGYVVSRTAMLGKFVEPQTELFRVADPSKIDVDAALTSVDAQRVHAGDRAKVRTRTGLTLEAVVHSVTPTLDEESHSAMAVVDPLPGQTPLMPGDTVTVFIMPARTSVSGVVLPAEAIQELDGREVVFVRTGNLFKARPVIVGARSAGRAAIISGLKAGEVVATANAFLIKAEMRKSTGDGE